MSKWINEVNDSDYSGQIEGSTEEWRTGETVSSAAETQNTYDFRAQTINNFQEPEEEEWTPDQGGEAPRAWDIHYTPSWFVEEQTNRKNPTYTPDETWTNEAVDAIANYVSGWKKEKPQEWRYGDPGWDTSTQLWRENIKPIEEEYQSAQSQAQAVQQQNTPTQPAPTQPTQQPDGGTRFTFYGNNPRTTALAIPQGGLNAPIAGQDVVQNLVNNNPRYKFMNVDTSQADYSQLATSGKFNYLGMPSLGGTDVKNAPAMSKYTQGILSSVMSASGPANIAKLAAVAFGGPVGWVYGGAWAASAAYSYGKSVGWWQGNEVADKFMELTDILDKKGAQAQGALAYGFEKAGGGDITDPSKFFENIKFLGDNFDTIMHYAFGSGKASTEFDSDVVGVVTSFTPNIGANVVGFGQTASRAVRNAISLIDDPEQRVRLERGQTTRNNLGLQGAYDIPEELQGSDALMYWMQFAQDLKDAGVTNPAELEYWVGHYINQVYGDLSNYSEFIEHELGDPGNTVENMQSRGMNVYGKVIGSENLQTAAKENTGNLAMDLAGQIPGAQGLIETIGRAFGKEIRSSGGIDEVLSTWNLENLNTADTSKLTAVDRRFSGINKDGTLQSLTPRENPNAVKNPFRQVGTFIGNLFSTTNEYRATLAGDAIFNYIDAGIEDAMSAREGDGATAQVDRLKTFVDEMANPETISPNSPFAQQSKTILFNSVKEDLAQSVRSQRGKIDKAINDYANLEPNRQVLNTLASALGITPHKLMDMYENNKPQLTQMILNKADQNGGKISGIDIDVEGREFGDRVIAMLSPFAGKDAKAYDPRGLMLQVSSAIADGVTDTLVGKYNIEQEGFLFRFGDSVKKMQHLWLLGLSPSYLANNLVNNVLTRSAIGWGGYMTSKTINNYMERFGYTPSRFAESTVETALDSNGKPKTNSDKPNSDKLRSAIRDRKKSGYKLFDKVDKGSDWISNHLGFFGKLSGWVEENESRQVMTSAMMTYMNRSWKAGVNFRKMDTQLENMIRAQNPDMVDTIYSAISSGINMKEIERAIFGTYIVPSVQDSLVDAARQMNIENPEDFVTEVFGKAAILDELQQALRGKRGEEIDAIVDRIGERMRRFMQVQLAEELSKRAEAITNNVTNCGFAEAIKLGQDTAEDFGEIWLKSQDMNTQIFDRRISEGLKTAEFRAIYQQHQKDLNERWAAVYARSQQTYVGILRGLGMTTETNQSYMKLMKQRDDLWVNFYQTRQPELFQPYLDALTWRGNDTFEIWDARVRKAWKEYSTAMSTEYQNTVKAEADLQKQMDDTFVKGLKKVVDKKYAKLADAKVSLVLEEIRNKRQEIIALNLERRAKADNTSSLNGKKSAYKETDAEMRQLKQDYINLQKQMYDTIAEFAPAAANPAEDSVMMDVDHEANIKADVTEHIADAQRKIAEKLANTMSDEIAETEDIPDIKATTPDDWGNDLRRNGLIDVAKNAGATDELAKTYADRVLDIAFQWEDDHPGKDFFQTVFGVRIESADEAELQDLSQKLTERFKVDEDSFGFSFPYDDTISETIEYTQQQRAEAQQNLNNGKFVPLSAADVTQMQEGPSREEAVRKLAQQIVDNVDKAFQDDVTTLQASINKLESDQQGLVRNTKEWRDIQKKKLSLERQMEKLQKSEKRRKQFTVDDYIAYINESRTEDGKPVLSDEQRTRMYVNVSGFGVDPDNSIARSIKNLRAGINTPENIPTKGTYVVQTYSFDYGGQQIVGAVYHDGNLVAYIPKDWKTTQIDYEGTKIPVLGVSVEHPNRWMYMIGDEIHEEPKRMPTGTNPFSPQMEADSLGDIDPTGEIGHKMLYEDILPILSRFKEVYKQNVNNAITSNGNIKSLDEKTRSLIRGYIDRDVRQDLMNTKFKAGKFGEMMRDAALLNYSKRYGFDNYLTLLFPYQFWNTRSMWNWINRMGGKGGKLWRRYARLKEMEERNKKEVMPSRISGKIGFYIPGLPDWMGDALFMPTSQLTVVGNFLDPAIEWATDDKVFQATAERYVQEAFDEGNITQAEYDIAMDPAKRNGSGVWQEMYARAQSEGKGDRDFGNLFKQYFGMSLPVSIGKAIITGDTDEWTQTPTTRMGTAWRALFGENIIGQGGQALLAGPERILRSAVAEATGNDGFRYNEFGNWGDYYIRQQVWDMVVEGRISAEDAVAACAEKESNKVWNEAADRQRDEILQKTQLLSATAPMKKIVSDYVSGNADEIGADWAYLLSSLLTTTQPTTVVREAERDWRETKAEVGRTYDTNDKKAREAIYEANPNYTYNNLRYETDEEQMLRTYLYKKITDVWYDLDKTEQDELRIAFGPEFQKGVLNKETRAIETMDLDRLAAYAQALNGSIPYLATDKLNTMNVPKINTNIVPQVERDAHRVYLKERERLHPGMADVSKIYYNLPVEDRKTFRNANPKLTAYMEWNTQYKKTHEDAANFLKRQTDYYNMIESENVIEQLDQFTLKELKRAAYSNGKVDDLYKPIIERAMYNAGVSDDYKYFIKTLMDYILGE